MRFRFFASAVSGRDERRDVKHGEFLLATCKITVTSWVDEKADQNNFQAFQDGYCLGLIEGVSIMSRDVVEGFSVQEMNSENA